MRTNAICKVGIEDVHLAVIGILTVSKVRKVSGPSGEQDDKRRKRCGGHCR